MVKKVHFQNVGNSGGFSPKPMNREILKLVEKSGSLIVVNGRIDSSETIQNGERISCLNATTGALIVVSGSFNGIDENNNILTTNPDKIVGTNTGVVVRTIKNTDSSNLHEEENTVFINSKSLLEIEKFAEEELEVGQSYHVRNDSGKSITKGVYQGYHKTNRDNVILWFDTGKFVALNPETCFTFTKMTPKEVKKAVTPSVSTPLTKDNTSKILYLAQNYGGAIFQNGNNVLGEIEVRKPTLCINMANGRIIYSGNYEGKENGHHLIAGKKIYDKGDGVLFRPLTRVLDPNIYKADFDTTGIDFYPSDKRNPLENIKKADELDFGELFFAGKGSDHRVVAGGYYLGYHTTDEGHVMLWFSDGNCVDVDREHIIIAPAQEK